MVRLMRPAIAGLAVAGALAACSGKKSESYGSIDTAKPADTTKVTTDTTTAATATPTPTTKWTSPTVIGFVETANSGEVALGKLGQKKATNPEVKSFAKLMVTEHTTMLAGSKKLATKLGVMADTAADDVRDLGNGGRDALKELSEKASGADWDKNYMDKMVDGHQKVLDKLQDAAKNTPDAELKTALETAVGKVQTHLTKAQDVRAKLK